MLKKSFVHGAALIVGLMFATPTLAVECVEPHYSVGFYVDKLLIVPNIKFQGLKGEDAVRFEAALSADSQSTPLPDRPPVAFFIHAYKPSGEGFAIAFGADGCSIANGNVSTDVIARLAAKIGIVLEDLGDGSDLSGIFKMKNPNFFIGNDRTIHRNISEVCEQTLDQAHERFSAEKGYTFVIETSITDHVRSNLIALGVPENVATSTHTIAVAAGVEIPDGAVIIGFFDVNNCIVESTGYLSRDILKAVFFNKDATPAP